ncbi:hypothetical protein F4819DRAFT_182157 [Hypoxylon fuscum]|nr:hypothetical protein F4819DRAFT_182157 [Hypoxylon fuscum]
MKFSGHLATIAVLAYQTDLALANDSTPFIGPLDPWKVNSLQVTVPAKGRSGIVDIELAIENPNKVSAGPAPHAAGGGYLPFSPSAANCSTGVDSGVTVQNVCTETSQSSYGVWTVDLPKGAVDPQNLELTFNLNYNVTRWGGILYKVYTATGYFVVGKNLAKGVCDDASGTCSFELQNGSAPVLVQPTMIACKGTCDLS